MGRVTDGVKEVHLNDFLNFYKDKEIADDGLLLINIRGGNGSGKSTAINNMMQTDDRVFRIVWDNLPKTIATVFPSYGVIALGGYKKNKGTGGCDRLKGFENVLEILNIFWKIPMQIIFEGIIVTSSHVKYRKMLSSYEKYNKPKRELFFLNLLPPLELCYERVYERNGGKEFSKDSVRGKYNQTVAAVKQDIEQGFNNYTLDNSNIPPEKALETLVEIVNSETKKGWEI